MIRALISDLGNVLLHFDHRIIGRRFAELYPEALCDEEAERAFWLLVGDFETGEADTREFLKRLGVLLNVPNGLDEEQFFEVWGDIFWLNSDYLEVLREMLGRVTLVLLSNTNPLHISFARSRFPEIFDLFDHTIYSFSCGFAKPDPRIFQSALDAAGVAPDEALYIDDIAAYTDVAASLGMHAYQYVSAEALRDVLKIYELRQETHPPHTEISCH
jgi:glucose-1-phosphatase